MLPIQPRDKKFFSFKNDATFTKVAISYSGQVPRIDMGNGVIFDAGNTGYYDYSGSTPMVNTVTVWKRELSQLANTKLDLQAAELQGTLDLSPLSNLGGDINIGLNGGLTGVTFPNSNQPISALTANACNLTGHVDLSLLTKLGGDITFFGNYSATGFTFPNTSEVITTLNLDLTNIQSETLDLSPLANLGGNFAIGTDATINSGLNPFVKNFIFPNSPQVFTNFTLDGFVGITSLDISGLSGLGGDFSAISCSSLTGATFPNTNETFTSFNLLGSNLKGTLDLSPLQQLGGGADGTLTSGIYLAKVTGLTEIILPTGSTAPTGFQLWPRDNLGFLNEPGSLNKPLDLSGLLNLGGIINIQAQDLMTGITFPISAGTFSRFKINACGINNIVMPSDCLFDTSLSSFSGIEIKFNPNLTGITFPNTISTGDVNSLSLFSNNLQGTIDISMLTGLGSSSGGVVEIVSNSGLTKVIFPDSSNSITSLRVDNNDLRFLNISGLTGIHGSIKANNNINLSGVTFPITSISSGSLTSIDFSSTSLQGHLDLSPLSNLGRDNNINSGFYLFAGGNLTGVTLPTNSKTLFGIDLQNNNLSYVDTTTMSNMAEGLAFHFNIYNNNLTTAEVNHMLVDFDNNTTGTTYVANSHSIKIYNNSAPDSSSGGFDGITAKSNLQVKGFTVTTD